MNIFPVIPVNSPEKMPPQAPFADLKDKSGRSFGFLRAAFVFLCGTLLLAELPVNYLSITGDGMSLASPVPSGASFTTTYVHSVEKTPVIDMYRIAGGKIWVWEEKVRSHNAGLPFDAPKHGSFIMDSGWMIIRGGRRSMESIAYRVGNAEIGRNTWNLPPYFVSAYERYPSRRVFMKASVRKFKDAPLIGWQKECSRKQ
jgi:hypothetical protein